jgi:hypothetical protein
MSLDAHQAGVGRGLSRVLLRRLGSSAAAVALVIVSMAWMAPTGRAEGPLYVPAQPPPAKESVDFTNHLNTRVRHLPAPLDPPAAESPAQVESRIRVLEHGVVVEQVAAKKPGPHPGKPAAATGEKRSTPGQGTSTATDAPAPLSIAFVAAGVLALLGLLLGVRGRHPGRVRQA